MLIIVLTMVAVLRYLSGSFELFDGLFGLVLMSYILLAASGNVINDYFDVEADRINKRHRFIAGNTLSLQQVVNFYWLLVGILVLSAVMIGFSLHESILPLLLFVSIVILWLYSALLKKIILIGNGVVSLLTVSALYPPTYIYLHSINQPISFLMEVNDPLLQLSVGQVMWAIAGLVFIQNLAREIIKDAEDINGDKMIQAYTLPMMIGEVGTIWLVRLLMLIFPVLYAYHVWMQDLDWRSHGIYWISIGAFLQFFVALYTMVLKKHKAIRWMKHGLKLSMFFVILYLFFA